ncbi:MAG TPA: hypothetical protein VNM90_21860, partial [Haliangium sp.]|nr:hypothetical protein [Haliangium sp.]
VAMIDEPEEQELFQATRLSSRQKECTFVGERNRRAVMQLPSTIRAAAVSFAGAMQTRGTYLGGPWRR